MIKGLRQPTQFVVGRGNRQRAPESLAIRYAIRHQCSMLCERSDRREAPAYVESGNESGKQQTYREEEKSYPSEAVEHSVCTERGNCDGQDQWPGSLQEGY